MISDLQQLISTNQSSGEHIRLELLEELFDQMYTIVDKALENMDNLRQMRDLKFDPSPPHATVDVIEAANACTHRVKMWLSVVSDDVFKHMISAANKQFSERINALWDSTSSSQQHLEGNRCALITCVLSSYLPIHQSPHDSDCGPAIGDIAWMIELQKMKETHNYQELFRNRFPMRELASSLNITRAWIMRRLNLIHVMMGVKDPRE